MLEMLFAILLGLASPSNAQNTSTTNSFTTEENGGGTGSGQLPPPK